MSNSNPSPYDLSAEATLRCWRREKSRPCGQKKNDRNNSDSPSPYDLSFHGGLARLAEIVRENPRLR